MDTDLPRPPLDRSRTFRVLRLENLVALAACVGLAILHVRELRWIPFLTLFAAIDLVGYVPGAIVHKLSNGRGVPPIFYALYDATHSLLLNALVAAAWCLLVGPEWALLAIPIHLCGDRALFGNFPAFDVFEPHAELARAGGR